MPYLISHGFHCTFQPLIPQLLQSPSQGAIQPSPGGLSSSSRPPPRGLALYYVHQFSGFGLVLHPVFSFWACPSLPIIQIQNITNVLVPGLGKTPFVSRSVRKGETEETHTPHSGCT